MTHRGTHHAAVAAWQNTTFTPVHGKPDPASGSAGPSDTETMVSRFFPLGRLRMAQAEPDGSDHAQDTQAGSAGGVRQPQGPNAQIAQFPDPEAARICRLKPAGQSRGAVSVGTRGKAIPARRVWGIPDLS